MKKSSSSILIPGMFQIILITVFLLILGNLSAQTGTYADSILPRHPRFESQLQPLRTQAARSDSFDVVFTGSSSIRGWKTLTEDFAPLRSANFGFGGSTLVDLLLQAPTFLYSLKTKLLVVYCGENDISLEYASIDDIFENFVLLMQNLRLNMPGTRVIFVSVKPSPKSREFLEKQRDFNRMARAYLLKQNEKFPRFTWVNIFDSMLNASGVPKAELFLRDKLHMNENGYRIWTRQLKPVIDSVLVSMKNGLTMTRE